MFDTQDALDVHREKRAMYGDTINAVFRHGQSIRVTDAAERELIDLARGGDSDAAETLILIYGSALAANHYARPSSLPEDDSIAALLSRFWEVVYSFDGERFSSIANTLVAWLRKASTEAQAEQWAVRIPDRTLVRFWGVLRRAGGDPAEGARIAPSLEMDSETFWSVWGVVSGRSDLDTAGMFAPAKDPFAAVDDYSLAHAALRAVDGDERDVTLYAYGFATGEPLTDAEVAEAISERDLSADDFYRGDRSVSRATVQRRRMAALSAMRAAIAVDEAS